MAEPVDARIRADWLEALIREWQVAIGRRFSAEISPLQRFARSSSLPAPVTPLEHLLRRAFDREMPDAPPAAVPSNTSSSIVRRAQSLISANCECSLAQIARELRCSTRHLARVFNRAIGCPPARVLEDARFVKATKLLTRTNLKIESVALSVGYKSKAPLFRMFKRRAGLTPAQFRKSFRRAT